jgi:hypothetical protein
MTRQASQRTEAQTEKRKRSNANLKPFKPGAECRGNRGGRPKGLITTALCKQLLRKAAKGGKSDLQAIVEAIVNTAKKGNAKAFCAIRDTVDGPPKQESQDNGAKILIQFTRDPPTPAIQVASKPNF